MQPELVVVLGLVSIGTLVLIGMRMRFIHRMESRKGDELEGVCNALAALHEQTRLMREEFSELEERLESQERLIGKAGDQVNTPV